MSGVGIKAIPPVDKPRLAVTFGCSVVLIGAACTAWQLAVGHSPDAAVVLGLMWGVGQSTLQTGIALHRRRERLRLAPRHLTTGQRRAAIRASFDGPVPDDPEVRREALRLSRAMRVELTPRDQVAGVIFCLVVAVAGLLAGTLLSRWWWLDSACFLIVGAWAAWRSRRRELAHRALEVAAAREAATELSGRGPWASR